MITMETPEDNVRLIIPLEANNISFLKNISL